MLHDADETGERLAEALSGMTKMQAEGTRVLRRAGFGDAAIGMVMERANDCIHDLAEAFAGGSPQRNEFASKRSARRSHRHARPHQDPQRAQVGHTSAGIANPPNCSRLIDRSNPEVSPRTDTPLYGCYPRLVNGYTWSALDAGAMAVYL